MFGVGYLGQGLVAAVDDAGNLSAASLPPSPSPVPHPDPTSTASPPASTSRSPPAAPPVKHKASLIYKHPKTVWSVAVLPGIKSGVPGTKNRIKTPFVCDVATGSADFRVRVFTPDPDRALQGEALKEAEKACGVGGGGSCGGEGGSGGGAGGDERLPPVSEMGVMVGGEDGQLSAFYDEVTGEAKVRKRAGGDEAVGGGRGRKEGDGWTRGGLWSWGGGERGWGWRRRKIPFLFCSLFCR